MKQSLLIFCLIRLLTLNAICEESRTITALHTREPIVLDGRADEPIWRRAENAKNAKVSEWHIMADGTPAPGKRYAFFAYDQNNLYVLYSAQAEDPESLLSLPEMPEDGDCVRLEVANASMGVDCENLRVQNLRPYLIPLESVVAKSKSGWTVEMAIPWEHVGGAPKAGASVLFNIHAHDTSVGRVTWAPVKDPLDLKNLGKLQLERSE